MIIGIDPGLTGAIALVSGENCLGLWDMPTAGKTHGPGRQVNPPLLADILNEINDEFMPYSGLPHVYLEQVASMPGQGVSSMFSFGHSFGAAEGVIAAIGYRYTLVRPQSWKRHFGLIGKDKDASRTYAIRHFPEVRADLRRSKDIGRADALLIAAYGAAQ